ncbi:glycoside hydrolase family 3 N-terminal domain-containing protein [Conexibacter woesei]|uniref:Exo-alpha-(1->6)-L-arabinopyranosidase n=1 Tax=Conexibacter woesei (strain DSM 14684 / CCUG 47730 / CIP 108061 / JCM 11494 / NBRC 100937 / ID131577) TaxID=469383 RepID=D3EZH8_CONWI|nr:glycoside hydrolase family 3 N-terminal domain-containing protein [Conexibacter woesei]ADB53816.1 glycoside hydrolase family 3 domain protein [Conexibacter woesei DSM 14684]
MSRHVSAIQRIALVAVLAALVALAFLLAPRAAERATAQDPNADVEAKIDDWLSRMTLEQKLGQLQQLDADFPSGRLRDDQLALVRAGRLGSTLNGRGAANTNAAQRVALEQSALRIPLLFGFDVIHGYRTVFPVPLAEASSWDTQAAESSAAIAAREARAAGVHWTFAPMVDVTRDPRWGRVVEGAGEDAFLGSSFSAARVRGFQGEDYSRPDRVAATAKHWVAYGGAEAGRDYNTVDTSERRLRELYFPPFRAAVDAGVASFMTSFNEINGVPATANPFVLRDVLRDEWGFDGAVVSDYTSIRELIPHGVAADDADAAQLALNAGTDIEMVSRTIAENGARLVADGRLSETTVDDAVRHVLRLKYRLGLFDEPYVDESREAAVLNDPAHRREARRIAARSMVLLKNDGGALPLPENLRRVAVVGPLADSKEDMLGTWIGDGKAADAVTVRESMEELLGRRNVRYAPGCDAPCAASGGFGNAVAAVRGSQAAVVVLGEPAAWSGEASSRSEIGLPGRQLQLLRAIHATGKPYVVVLMNGRPLTLDWAARRAPAIVEAWYPGTEAGRAVTDVLFGDVNPGGKLPVTFPRNVGQIPIHYDQKPTGRPPDPANKYTSKYLDVDVTPQYPFGHGLSYTTFALSNIGVSPGAIAPDGEVTVSADVRNSGRRAGDEVVQLYVRDEVASVTRPLRALRGFERVTLQPGESRRVTFRLDRDDLGLIDARGDFTVEPGRFRVWVSSSSVGGLEGGFTVEE